MTGAKANGLGTMPVNPGTIAISTHSKEELMSALTKENSALIGSDRVAGTEESMTVPAKHIRIDSKNE